jgi:predicted ester cyclase
MIMDQNKEIIRQLYTQVASLRQRTVIYRSRGTGNTHYAVPAKHSSLRAFGRFFSDISEAFPDFEITINNLLVKGDRVMARYTIMGTHKKHFLGVAPTFKKMMVTGIDVFRLSNGKVVEHWDAAHQINALPETSQVQIPMTPIDQKEHSFA